jgi:PKD repeat protein
MTLRRGTPLLALRMNDVRMDALLPGAGATLGDLQLPSLNLTATTLTELADPTPQEREFFGDEPVQFSPGLNLQGKLPLDQLGAGEVLGYPAGSEATLSGTLGANVTLSRVNGSSASLRELALSATLPPATNSRVLPRWVRPTGDTTLGFRYTDGSVAASFATAATVTLANAPLSTTIEGRLTRTGQRTSIGFNGTISNWRKPFGVSWINSLDQATVKLDTTFGGGQPATVDAAVTGATMLGGKRFELEFAVSRESSASASLTARLADRVRLGEVMRAFPNLSDAAAEVANNRGLDELEIGPVAVSATTGPSSTFELTGETTFAGVTSDVLVALRSGGAFTVGVKARGEIDLRALTPQAPSLNLPSAAMVLSSQSGRLRPDQLTGGEFNFYKSLYGCPADATPASCKEFKELELKRALKLVAAFDMGDQVETMASAIGIQTTGNVRLEGSVPVFGGRDFSLTASLGNFRFAQQPDWFDRGDVSLEIGTEGLKFVGGLRVKIEREGWTKACDGLLIETRCYDLLDFRVSAGVALQPTPKLTLAGTLTTQNPWRNAFGQEWLEINRLALQLGVKLGAGPEVTMGFQGDIKIGSKDIAAALKVGLAPAPPPAFVRPNLIGFSAASKAGLALSDLLWLNEKLTGTRLDTASLPDVSLRNLYLQYSQETDRDLCLTQGVRFNADLYVGNNLPPIESGTLDPNGCRTLDVDPETHQTCLAHKANGCLASVYGRLDGGGVIAGAELNGFTLGPIALNDSMLALALTPAKQQLRVKGGLRIASGSYEFAKGQADLDISRAGMTFKGDAALFNQRMRGFIEANAAFDLRNPSFAVRGWLSATDRGVMNGLVSPRAQDMKNALVVLRPLLQFMSGSGSVANVRDLKAKMVSAGVTVPYQVDKMINVMGDMQAEIDRYGRPALSFDVLLNGLRFNVPGVPGVWTPNCWGYRDGNGTCWGVEAPPTCAGTVRDGQCWTTPPFGVSVPGICETLGVPSADCSWPGLMRRYVRPAMLSAVHSVTGLWVDENTLTNVLNSLTSGTGSLVSIECAYFSADASALAQGNVNLELATRLRLFGQPVQFGARWNFAAAGGSPGEIASKLFQSLFSPSSTTCPDQPAAPAQGAPSTTLTASLSPSSLDENGETSVRATFDEIAMDYPAVTVLWGDGATTTVPAGESRTITPSHRYANEGNYPVTVAVGTFTKQLTARVRNVAPRLHYVLAGDGLAVDEQGVVSLRGSFTDPGEGDRHTLNVDWGDGSVPEVYTLAAGARTIDVAHRYADDDGYTVTATVSDDGGGAHSRATTATIRNVAPSKIDVRALKDAIEGTLTPYSIKFDDPGKRDAHTVTVDWADGRPAQTYPVPAGRRSVEVPYLYEDDGARDVRITVADDDGGRNEATVGVKVANAAPRIDLKLPGTVRAGEEARLAGTITDPGVADAQTVTIDWGTGKLETIELEAGKRTFEAAMQYSAPGRYPITAEANDGKGRGRKVGAITVVA